jgi:tryptophan halogenase
MAMILEEQPIRSVLIVGGGTAGWMTAAVLSKAFGRKLSIKLIESDEIGIVGVGEATIPMIRLINNFLRIDENDFLRASQGTFKLGIEFNNWRRIGDTYMHAFGDIGMPLGLTPFLHYWLRARHEGSTSSLWDYSLNYQAAISNRFAPLEKVGETALGGIKHAYHFDASLYARFLRTCAERLGVQRIEGKIVDVVLNPENGFIEGVSLEGGEKYSADLFVDCSGFRALLIEGALKAGFIDWTHWLPCDRAVAAPCEHGDAIRPYTQATARDVGWQWRIPLQHRVGNGHVYSSAHVSDDDAARTLTSNLEGALIAEPRIIKFRTGARKKFWIRNCVAIGLSSGFLEPLESTSIHLIQSAVSRLVSMFPDRYFDEALIAEYNRQSHFEMERIRDFIILHYFANERTDTAFWEDCRSMVIPDSLSAKTELFKATGRIYREREELFTEMGWQQVFLGQGVIPERYHPLADSLSRNHLAEFLGGVRKTISHAAASLPRHEEYIARSCAAVQPRAGQ